MENVENKQKNDDANFLQSLISEAEEEGEAKEILIEVKDILPVLKQYNADLQIGQNNIINERLGMERMVTWYQKLYGKINEKFNEAFQKVNSINEHINQAVRDAPEKLVVSVRVSDDDFKAIKSICDNQVQEIKDLHCQQMKEMVDLHARQMKELNARIDNDVKQQYERGNRHRSEVSRMLKDSDGLYLRGFWYWVGGTFFWIGVVTIALLVFFGCYDLYQIKRICYSSFD